MAPHARRPRAPPEGWTRIVVLTARSGQLELEVSASETGADLRRRLTELGEVRPNRAELFMPEAVEAAEADARLLHNGVPLRLDRSLRELGLGNGGVVRLLPGLRKSRAGHVKEAPRGFLMTPGTRAWEPTSARGARTAFFYEADAPYSANLRHPELHPHPRLAPPRSHSETTNSVAS